MNQIYAHPDEIFGLMAILGSPIPEPESVKPDSHMCSSDVFNRVNSTC